MVDVYGFHLGKHTIHPRVLWVIVLKVAFSETPEVPLISTVFYVFFLLQVRVASESAHEAGPRDGRSEQELSEVNVWNDLMVKKLEGKIPSGCI